MMTDRNHTKYTNHLPDLMTEDDYMKASDQKRIRLQLKITDQGIEIIGDSQYPHLLDKILEALEPHQIEKVLCG